MSECTCDPWGNDLCDSCREDMMLNLAVWAELSDEDIDDDIYDLFEDDYDWDDEEEE